MLFLPILVFTLSSFSLARSDPRMEDFFPDIKGNLTKVTWKHAVNSQKDLKEALNDTKIMMLEADVVIGKVGGKGDDVPIMSHDVATSDLSLQDFLSQVLASNNNTDSKKGVKLDFKKTDAFQKSVTIITDAKADFPIWLNADIVKGPVDASVPGVDAKTFLDGAKNFNTSILSLGWSTKFNSSQNQNDSYTDEQIDNMIKSINSNNITQEITFAVRAALATQSGDQFKNLTAAFGDRCSLTIWSSDAKDVVDAKKLQDLILDFGVNKVYIDLPEDILKQLDLGSSAVKPGVLGALLFALISLIKTIF